MRYFIYLAYNGQNYCGWQNQPNGLAVQQIIETALTTFLQTETKIVGAGRTDAGVHARQMVAHFDSDRIDLPELADRLNCLLPQDVVINKIVPVAQQAHARFSAVERTYRYYITREKEPFYYRYKYYHPAPLQIEAMNRGARILMQYSDFTSFSKLHTDVFTNHCTIVQAKWEATGNDCVFTIAANRFLRNMVRAIVGTLLDMGRGKIDESALRAIVEAGDRSRAGQSAPAHALFLEKIDYPDEIFQV